MNTTAGNVNGNAPCPPRRATLSASGDGDVRLADVIDAPSIGRLLHDFNTEFDEPTPGPDWLAARIVELIAEGETGVLLAGAGPDGLAVLRLRPAIWSQALECYLAELYVAPAMRGAVRLTTTAAA